jgi:hypothetical protein
VSSLQAVLRVRTLLERRALAEQATAERAATQARAVAERARAARAGYRAGTGGTTRDALTGARVGTLALQESVLRADQADLAASRDAELAAQRRVQASVARKSVERLEERRSAATAAAAAKRVERQLDDLAIDRWRRS